MNSTEIKTKWDASIPTHRIRVGTSRFNDPGRYAKVSLSGTGRSAGVFEVEAVENTLRDEQRLDKYVILNPNVAEALGYEPNEDKLLRQQINVRVEAPVPETNLATCSEATIHSEEIEADILTSYLKNRNYILRGVTEAVSLGDIEQHTGYSFSNSADTFVTFRPVGLSPSRSSLIVRDSTDITVTDEPSGTAQPGGSASPSSPPGDGGASRDPGKDSEYSDEEVGEGFHVSPEPPEHTFDDIVGLHEVKDRVRNLTALTDDSFVSDLESEYGSDVDELLPESYSMLLYGPPGCGKTMVAHGIANEFQKAFDNRPGSESAAFISVKGSDILASLKGQSESRVEAIFEEARRSASEEGYAVLFFDEIETLIPDRNSRSTEAHDSRLTVAFLQEMNNIGDNVMVLGATNLPFTIDSAASRRFKTKLFVPHPGEDALAELWEMNLGSLNTQGPIDYDKLGRASSEFTPSEIDAMLETDVQSDIVEGMLADDPQPLKMDYLERKLDEMQPRIIEEYVSSVDQPDLFADDQMQGYRELEEYIDEHKSGAAGAADD